MKVVLIAAAVLAALVLIGWLGLQVRPRPFVLPNLPQSPTTTVPVPAGLPAPVARFYRAEHGDEVPVIKTVIISGTGRIRPFGIWLPTRYIMVHNAGHDYRHYFEATWFGIPFLKVNEGYVDGQSFFESPMGTYYDDPNTNQGANLALWAEGGWFPSLWVNDPRAKWEPVDDNTARLLVPFEDQVETFVVHFNPETSLVDSMEAMRFRAPADRSKLLWVASYSPDHSISYATWADDGKPWLELSIDRKVQNVDVSHYIRQRGN